MQVRSLINQLKSDLVGSSGSVDLDKYRYLAVIMGLPLVDGVFLTIVLTGGLDTIADSVLVGSFVLGGGATIGIILSEFDGDRIQNIKVTFVIAVLIGIAASLQASLATVIAPIINVELFKYGAIIALIVLAVRIAPIEKTDNIVSPSIVILAFLSISLNPMGLSDISAIQFNIEAAVHALIAVFTAFTISSLTIILRPVIVGRINTKSLKYATSVGLIAITLSIIGIVPSLAAPIVFIITVSASVF